MPHRMLKVTLRAAILAFAVSFFLIFIFAYAAYRMPDVPDSLITVFAYAALAVGGLLCGILFVPYLGRNLGKIKGVSA